MRTGFIFIGVMFLASLGYVIWHLWRITPGGWPVKMVEVGRFLFWIIAPYKRILNR